MVGRVDSVDGRKNILDGDEFEILVLDQSGPALRCEYVYSLRIPQQYDFKGRGVRCAVEFVSSEPWCVVQPNKALEAGGWF